MQKIVWFGVIRCHSRSLAMSPFNREHTIFLTLIETIRLILYCFQNKASYLSKFVNFNRPQLHLAPLLGVTSVEFHRDLWHQKTRLLGLTCGMVVLPCLRDPMLSRFCRTLTYVRQTDTDTGP